jgi:hypothetical protein
MKDMTLLEDLGAALDPSGPPPQDLRRRVLTEALRPQPTLRRWLGLRTSVRVALAGGLAAVLTAAVLLLQVVPIGNRAPAAQAQAAEILQAAAAQASHQADLPVRPEQFIRVESIATVREVGQATGESSVEQMNRMVWLSADGTHDGMIRETARSGGRSRDIVLPGCVNGAVTQSKGGVTATSPCTPTPGFVADLPTDADTMLAYLYRGADDTKNPRDQEAFSAGADLIREAYLRPAALSALFAALARIPGVAIVGDITDEAGRRGVAISLTEVQGTRSELIFDRSSHAYLGTRTVMASAGDGLNAGDVLYSAAVLSVGVVDRVGS